MVPWWYGIPWYGWGFPVRPGRVRARLSGVGRWC